jgi:branched-chain amino acid transport system ATP-binding protein
MMRSMMPKSVKPISGGEILRVHDLTVRYGSVVGVSDVDLTLKAGQVVALLGPNGSGKSSLFKGICGSARASGSVRFCDVEVSKWSIHRRARSGLVQVPQTGRIFDRLTVDENLMLGGYRHGAKERARRSTHVLELFPELVPHQSRPAAVLSGGLRQMLAVARALMANPRAMLLDEPSLGLAPKAVDAVFDRILEIRATGIPMIVIDQNAVEALRVADYVYVLNDGRIVYESSAEKARAELELVEAHLGLYESPKPTTPDDELEVPTVPFAPHWRSRLAELGSRLRP